MTAHEDSLCSGCGQPKHLTYNPDAEGWFEAREITCAGCAAQQQHGAGKQQPTPGGKVYVTDTRPAGLDLRPWTLAAAGDQVAEDS